jgi:glyoxylase-like metal-dependent hydrolase (beta-lactamase superfamily II)
MSLNTERIELGIGPGFTENCYILCDAACPASVVIIDPGAQPERILAAVGTRTVERIICTHRHFDHTGALPQLMQATGAEVVAHALDAVAISDPVTSGAALHRLPTVAVSVSHTVDEGDRVTVGKSSLLVLHTPGHTEGSICLYDEEDGLLFAGDTLFFEASGRTDFPTGSPQQMRESLERLARLPDATIVHPGHDEDTTIGHERRYGVLRGLPRQEKEDACTSR